MQRLVFWPRILLRCRPVFRGHVDNHAVEQVVLCPGLAELHRSRRHFKTSKVRFISAAGAGQQVAEAITRFDQWVGGIRFVEQARFVAAGCVAVGLTPLEDHYLSFKWLGQRRKVRRETNLRMSSRITVDRPTELS